MIAIETVGVTIGLTVTIVVPLTLVHPFWVIVKLYVPAIAEEAFEILGF